MNVFSVVLGLLLSSLLLPPCQADSPSLAVESTPAVALDADHLSKARKAAESNSSLSDTVKSKVLEFYDQAGKWLQEANIAKGKQQQLEALIKDAPMRIEELKAKLTAGSGEEISKSPEFTGQSLDQLQLLLTQQDLEFQQKKEALKQQQDELTSLLIGAKGFSEEISSRSQAIEQIDKDLKTPVADEPPPLTQARSLALQARALLRSHEVELVKRRFGSLDLLTNLAQAERDVLEADMARDEPRLEVLKQQIQSLREKQATEASQKAEALKLESSELPPEIRAIAQENAGYRKELEAVIIKEKSVTKRLELIHLALEDIKSDFERTRQRVEVVGPTQAIGKMLVRRREALPSPQSYRRTSAERAAQISKTTDRQLEIDELLREQGSIQASVNGALNGLKTPALQTPQLEADAARLSRIRRNSLNELQTVYGRYIAQLTALDLVERRRVEISGAFIEYIDDELLWIPGYGISDLVSWSSLSQTFTWIFSVDNWLAWWADIHSLLQRSMGSLLILAGLVLLLLKNGYGAADRLDSIARKTYKIRTDSFMLSLRSLGLSLAISGAWPLLMISLGWLLERLSTADPFSIAIAHGLVKSGEVLFGLHFLRQICRPNGLGERHLRWNPEVCKAMVRSFSWLWPLVVPLSFFVAVSSGHDTPQAAKIPGQLAFILVMGVSLIFTYRIFRGRGALMNSLLGVDSPTVLAQMHFLWFPAFLALPVALAITSVFGYHNAAIHFSQQAEMTFWFFVVLFLFKELILRFLYIEGRRLRFEDALRRREELRTQREHPEEEESSPISLDIPEMDFDELGEQAKRLVRAGFLFTAVIGSWMIWRELLPALDFLNTTELPFQTSRVVDGIAKELPLTLGDLVVGLIFIFVTLLAAKNLPGILEITLLQRLPLDAGTRYAITALSQYAIGGIGIVMAFSHIGLQWSNIQWLVAALSVGLGFGLQEIVANFISGIILLFERPIRVGDVVTLNNTTGVVSRIRIRATTITKYDKQELLIPNKQFITAEVTNWTLSDTQNRVLITVGVGYEADVDRAMELLLEAAHEHPEVLEDPKPVASFEAFGDSALTLTLRSYLGSMDNRLATTTELHRNIREKLNAAGISIAFPQRDLHLDTSSPLEVRLQHPPDMV